MGHQNFAEGHPRDVLVTYNVPMAVNERLRTALVRAGLNYAQFAEAVGVDPKTAERWVSTGRTPHRTTAYKAARTLREDWPICGHLSNRAAAGGESTPS